MKKAILLSVMALTLVYCKTKKNTETTAKAETKTETKAGAKTELSVAQKRWPGTTTEDLAQGKQINDTKCTTCHGAKRIETRSEENWKHMIDVMAPKAKLTADEKDKLTRYILAYREAHTTTD
jgi:cytochrome c5